MTAHWKRSTGLGTDGCYNDRTIRGSKQKSLHSVGRAVDLHADSNHPTQRAQMESYVQWLIVNHAALGVQYLIWNRRSWRPDRGWKSYTGTDPHNTHAHVELTVDGAATPSSLWAAPGTKPTPKPPTSQGFLMALTDAQQKQLLDLTAQTAIRVAKLEAIIDGAGRTAENPNGKADGTMLGRIRDAVARVEAKLK